MPGASAPSALAAADQSEDRLILRREAATIVGVSVPTIRRYETSTLKPIRVDEWGVHWHSLRACERLSKALGSSRPASRADSVDGATSAAAFKLFDAGADAADVVEALEIMPADARVLQKEWADIRGVMLICGETLTKIRSLRMKDDDPILTGEELLLFLEHAESPSCRVCSRNPVFCLRCYHLRPRRAEEVLALAIRRADEREAARERERVERDTYEQARQRATYDPAAAAVARAEREERTSAPPGAQRQMSSAPTTPPTAGAGATDATAPDGARDIPAAASATQSLFPGGGPADTGSSAGRT